MEIKDVKWVNKREIPVDDNYDLPNPYFEVTLEDDSTMRVPPDPLNRHYQEIKEWFTAQESEPFEYDWED